VFLLLGDRPDEPLFLQLKEAQGTWCPPGYPSVGWSGAP
jgi:tartrate dehydratase alpha subunit/fumarate hydratase class I-like protein